MKNIYHVDSAYFLDNDKTIISAFVTELDEETDRRADFTRVIEVKPSAQFDEFVEQVSLEKVEENTVRIMDESRAEFEENEKALIARIKKELGADIIATDKPVAGGSFDPNNMSSEDLFKLKLQAFEIEEVKGSKNRALKARVRKADSFMEVMAFTSAIIMDSLASEEADEKPKRGRKPSAK